MKQTYKYTRNLNFPFDILLDNKEALDYMIRNAEIEAIDKFIKERPDVTDFSVRIVKRSLLPREVDDYVRLLFYRPDHKYIYKGDFITWEKAREIVYSTLRNIDVLIVCEEETDDV